MEIDNDLSKPIVPLGIPLVGKLEDGVAKCFAAFTNEAEFAKHAANTRRVLSMIDAMIDARH